MYRFLDFFSFFSFLFLKILKWIKVVTSPGNRQANPLGPMGSSSGTGPLVSTWENQHSFAPTPLSHLSESLQVDPGPNCGQQKVRGARYTRHSSLHTRIWYPLRSGMALESAGFFSPDGLWAKRVTTLQKLFSVRLHVEMAAQEKVQRASDWSCTTEDRTILQPPVILAGISTEQNAS